MMTHHQTERFAAEHDPSSAAAMRGPGYSRRRQGDFIGALTDAVRDNPMSAALIGMGALWLYMGGNRTSLIGGKGRSSLIGTVAHGAEDLGHGAADAASRMGHAVSSGVSSAASGVAHGVSSAASSVGEAAGRIGERVRGSFEGVDAEAAYHEPGMSGDGWESEPYSDWRSQRHVRPFSIGMVQQNMKDLFERHPVAIGVAGLALGAGLAASLPITARERETLGSASDVVHDKAASLAGQARDLAGAAADEARQQGLGGDALRGASARPGARTGL